MKKTIKSLAKGQSAFGGKNKTESRKKRIAPIAPKTSTKKTTKKKRSSVNKSAVFNPSSAKNIEEKLTDQASLSLDSFLVNEQINYSDKLPAKKAEQPFSNIEPIINDLDKLILGERRAGSFKGILPSNQIQISLNKQGQVKREKMVKFSGSIHQLDLKKEKEDFKETEALQPAKSKKLEAARVNFDEFKIFDAALTIPKTTLIKKEKLTKWFVDKWINLKTSLKNRSKDSPASIKSSWILSIKTTLNFMLVALLLILPIRALFFYQHLEITKGQVLGISENALSDLELGAQAASQADWLEAGNYFLSASNYFNLAQENLESYNQTLIQIAKNLPATGDLIKSGESLLKAGQHLTKAAGNLTTVLNQIKQSEDFQQTITDNLSLINLALNNAQEEVNLASDYILEVQPKVIPEQYRDYFIQVQNKLPDFSSGLKATQNFIKFSLNVLGHQVPKRYLFLFQNNNELRATGGFLGSAALVDLKKGEITNLEVPSGGLYDLKGDFFEKIIAPAPMHLLGTPWMAWDANWWPDFPTSAKKITWFWEKSGWPTVDGVITFNASLLPKLLEIVGDIEMPDYNQLLTPETVILALQHEVEFEYDRAENRPKKIIAELMPIIIEKLLEIPTDQTLPLLLTLNQALTEKEIQFYFLDEELQKQVEEKKWAGQVLNSQRDYLLVVNQNIAGGKSDAVVEQKINHYAYLQPDGSLIDTVAITRTHRGSPDDVFEKVQNNSYIRVYVPLGSQILEVTGYDVIDPELFKEVYEGYHQDEDLLTISGQITKDAKTNTDVYSEFGKTVFGNWLMVEPGEAKTITFSYRLPFSLDFSSASWLSKKKSQPYSLLVQSQSGRNQTVFSSQLYLDKNLKINWSGGTAAGQPAVVNNEVKFNTLLNTDHYYGVLIGQR
ncbi:DUF4012 domain-containing protein [Patescibacteria group bacterium]|nr:DUF4012 domain-containing protein [Patescibacteria group bacterium]